MMNPLKESSVNSDKCILGENLRVSYDSLGINSNRLVVGGSGSGKTRGYVIPNLFCSVGSKIVCDTKTNLYNRYGKQLMDQGYKVECIDFVNSCNSTIGYNPLQYVRKTKNGLYRDSDIKKISEALCSVQSVDCTDPFWARSAQMYISFAIGYVKDVYAADHHTLADVEEVIDMIGSIEVQEKIEDLERMHPNSLTVRLFYKIMRQKEAEKMHASIIGVVNNAISQVVDNEIVQIYSMKKMLSFEDLAETKMILFLNVSDCDNTRESLINLFYTQALQELIRIADFSKNSHLKIPVNFFLDDFASNAVIPDFDKIISIVRSRGISLSIILQSITQLYSMYGKSKAVTILDNCDTQIYLGGMNVETAEYFGVKMDKLTKSLLSLPLEMECVFIRGQDPKIIRKFDLTVHEQELTGCTVADEYENAPA